MANDPEYNIDPVCNSVGPIIGAAPPAAIGINDDVITVIICGEAGRATEATIEVGCKIGVNSLTLDAKPTTGIVGEKNDTGDTIVVIVGRTVTGGATGITILALLMDIVPNGVDNNVDTAGMETIIGADGANEADTNDNEDNTLVAVSASLTIDLGTSAKYGDLTTATGGDNLITGGCIRTDWAVVDATALGCAIATGLWIIGTVVCVIVAALAALATICWLAVCVARIVLFCMLPVTTVPTDNAGGRIAVVTRTVILF